MTEELTIKMDEFGSEIPDPTPISIPIGLGRSDSMDERIRRIIQHSLHQEALKLGAETFEEADDFDIEDDPLDPTTPWESDFDMATAHAAERGVVQPPPALDPKRMEELRNKYTKPKKAKEVPPEPSE